MTTGAFSDRVTSVAQIHHLRANVSAWLVDAGHDAATISTVLLVLSELCTNALVHGRTELVEVRVDIDANEIAVQTRYEDHALPGLPVTTSMPAPSAPQGRGLAVVDRLVDRMTLDVDPPVVVRRCWLATGRPIDE